MKPITVAVAGKGGTGKTTICGILIKTLAHMGQGPVLAVDADANANLNEVLGLPLELTLGDIRENIAHADTADPSPIPIGMSKSDYADFMFADALVESEDCDLLVMGHTQGKGCYCFVNDLLRTQIERYANHYRYIIADNEAGLEHISRGTLPAIDVLFLVSDCSRRGVQAAGRIQEMVQKLRLQPKLLKLIVNRAPGGKLDDGILEEIRLQGLDLLAVLPQDDAVYASDCAGQPSSDVPETSAIKQAFAPIADAVLSLAK